MNNLTLLGIGGQIKKGQSANEAVRFLSKGSQRQYSHHTLMQFYIKSTLFMQENETDAAVLEIR